MRLQCASVLLLHSISFLLFFFLFLSLSRSSSLCSLAPCTSSYDTLCGCVCIQFVTAIFNAKEHIFTCPNESSFTMLIFVAWKRKLNFFIGIEQQRVKLPVYDEFVVLTHAWQNRDGQSKIHTLTHNTHTHAHLNANARTDVHFLVKYFHKAVHKRAGPGWAALGNSERSACIQYIHI